MSGGSCQRNEHTFTAEADRYTVAISHQTNNYTFDASSGPISITLSFWARGDLSGLTTGIDSTSNRWVHIEGRQNDTSYTETIVSRKLSEATTDGLSSTAWRKFVFSAVISNTATRKISIRFVFLGADTGLRPTTGESYWLEVTGVQVEKSPYATLHVPTTTAALTRPKDVLTMATAGNRNAAEETIIMQVTPWYSPSADMFSVHTLLDNDNFGRKIEAYMFGAGDDSYLMCTPVYHPSWWGTTVSAGLGSYFTAYQPVTIGLVVRQSGTYAELYINGELVDSTTDAWQAEAWGAAMYMLSDHDGANQFDGLLNAMTVYNRALTAAEVAYVTNLLNGAA